MKIKTLFLTFAITSIMALSLCGCSQKETEVPAEPEVTEQAELPEATETAEAAEASETTANITSSRDVETKANIESSGTEDFGPDPEECNIDFSGEYRDENENKIVITQNNDGTYTTHVDLYRLADFDDDKATAEGNSLWINSLDPAENSSIARFFLEQDGTYTLEFTYINWEYIKEGDSFPGFKK